MTKPLNTYDVQILPNQTFHLGLTLKDDDGIPLNLTAWSFTGSIKKTFADTIPVMYFTCSILDPTSGSMQIYLSADSTWTLENNPRYVYDVIASVPATTPVEKLRILQGNVKINYGVTIP